MIWSTVPFAEAHSALVSSSVDLDLATITAILDPIKSDLQQLLATPPKSEQSRAVLAKKVIDIDGDEVELNDAFLNDAARVADELNLDEILAAKLVFYAIEDSRRLQVSAVESALTLFYVRRQYILDTVRFGLESLPLSDLGLILGADAQRLSLIVDALKAVERSMEDLDEKIKTGEFMGLSRNPEFSQIVTMQRSFLVKEHEALGNILFSYFQVAAASETRPESLLNLLNHLATFEALDSRLIPYFVSLSLWLSEVQAPEFTKALYNYFTSSTTPRWKLPCWQAGLSLVAFTALADEDRVLPEPITYQAVVGATKRAIDEGALEFWMSLSDDVQAALGNVDLERFAPLVRLRVPKFVFWQTVPSLATQENLQTIMESLATDFIMSLADVLKEMRLSEEDMYLAMSEIEDEAQTVSPGVDLERFFLFVAITFRGRSSSQTFFEDEGDALHGFLTWAADCQVSFMSATFTELMASLANSPESCMSVHKFLANDSSRTSPGDDGFLLTWPAIYDVIEYYIRGMSSPQAVSGVSALAQSAQTAENFAVPGIVSYAPSHFSSASSGSASVPAATLPTQSVNGSVAYGPASGALLPTASRNAQFGPLADAHPSNDGFTSSLQSNPASHWGLPASSSSSPLSSVTSGAQASSLLPPQQQAQFSDDTILVLSAYLHLVARVTSQQSVPRDYLRGRGQSGSEFGHRDIVPLLFKLLKLKQPVTEATLAALTPFVDGDMWPMLDQFVLGKFDEALQSLEDAVAFVTLVENLVKDHEIKTAHIGEYIDFVLKTVLPWATSNNSSEPSKSNNDRGLKNTKTLLQLSGLGMLKAMLSKNPYNETAFRACFVAKVYESLLSILTIGIDQVNDLDASHPLAQTVTRCVEVVCILVELSTNPSWSFDKPVLYHLQVVPHLALYAGSRLRNLSLASINLLSLLDQSPEFKPTINRQSRILSILSSTTEATRIRVGLMTRLEDPNTEQSVKIALLELIARQLRSCGAPKRYMTVAHYLLGFRQSELGLELKLELDSGIGGISSGSSLLSAICDSLLQSLLAVHKDGIRLLRLCSEILWYLVEDPLTSEMLLDYLRRYDYWLNTISYEHVHDGAPDHVEDVMAYRATMLEIWIAELQLCQKRLLLTIEGHYLEALVPMVFTLVDLSTLPKTPSALKCLNAWCRLIPVLISSGDRETGQMFIARIIQMLVIRLPQYSRENAEFAVPVASLLVFLFEKYQQHGSDDSVARHMHMLFEGALLSLQPAQVNTKLRSDLYSICFQNLRLVLEKGSTQTQLDTLSTLHKSGVRVFQIACDDILGYPNETLRLGALLFIQLSAALSRQLDSPLVSNALLQYNFVSVFIQQLLDPLLASVVAKSPQHHQHSSHVNGSSNGSTNGLNNSTHQPSTSANSVESRNSDNGTTSNGIGKDSELDKLQFLKISLSLLCHIARTRDGASNTLGAGILKILDPALSGLGDDFLLLVVQLLIAIVVSMGPENTPVLHEVRSLLERNSSVSDNALRRDATLNHALQGQTVESEVSYLARNFTILISLTESSTAKAS